MGATGVILGGPSPEHDVSVLTGLQAARASSGARALYWAKTGDFFEVDAGLEGRDFAGGVPKGATALRLVAGPGGGFVTARGGVLGKERRLELDVVLNCCHGGPGEDGTLQAALDLAGLAYTGPTAAGAALGMDKLAFAGVVAAAGLPSLPRALLGSGRPAGEPQGEETEGERSRAWPGFPGPYIVKPRYGGSSIGIEVVEDAATARARLAANPHLRRGAVVEPYRPDLYDLQVAVRSWPALALSAIERPLRSQGSGEILTYSDKYVGGEGMVSAPRELPAVLDAVLDNRLRDLALQVSALVGLRGVARLDFLSDGKELFVNEVNTIPGSLAKYLWVDPAVAFPTLLDDLVAEARAAPSTQWITAGADGSALRSAGTIAGKLG